MITEPRLGLMVRRHSSPTPLGRIICIVKKPFKGSLPGDLYVKKPNGDIVKVHRAWVTEVLRSVSLP